MNSKVISAFVIGLLIFSLTACKSDGLPGRQDVKRALEHHFNREIYKDYVEVLDAEVLEKRQDTYMDGKYADLLIEASIRVKKGHVISKRYTATSFDVNEKWAENFEATMQAAESEEERQNIISLFEANTFSEGEHTIEGTLTYALFEGKWHLLTTTLFPAYVDRPEEIIISE